jgi:hypothetical protein
MEKETLKPKKKIDRCEKYLNDMGQRATMHSTSK